MQTLSRRLGPTVLKLEHWKQVLSVPPYLLQASKKSSPLMFPPPRRASCVVVNGRPCQCSRAMGISLTKAPAKRGPGPLVAASQMPPGSWPTHEMLISIQNIDRLVSYPRHRDSGSRPERAGWLTRGCSGQFRSGRRSTGSSGPQQDR